jgi:hypothetical protein
VLSRPVTYLTVSATGDGSHDLSLLIDVDPLSPSIPATSRNLGPRRARKPDRAQRTGSRDQRVLNRPGDDLRIDWGYFHLAAPDSEKPPVRALFKRPRELPGTGGAPRRRRHGHAAHAARQAQPISPSPCPSARLAQPVRRHVLLSYTEDYAIEYLGRKLRPYWQRNNLSVQQMLADAEYELPALKRAARPSTRS